MINLTINWDEVTVSSIIAILTSGVIAYGIAWYFRFKSKSKIEVVFEDNRQQSFLYLFTNLADFDSYFGSFYDIFEKDVMELKGKDREIIRVSPIMSSIYASMTEGKPVLVNLSQDFELIRKFESTKKNLEPMLEQMRKYYKGFSDSYFSYLNYIHDTFLKDVNRYYSSTIEYTRYVLQGHEYSTYIDSRRKFAHKIIEYVEADETIDKTKENIAIFIKKWKERESKIDVPPHSSTQQ